MNIHKNARLTPLGRERLVRQVEGGELVLGEAKEAPNAEAARRRAHALAGKHAGALAFRRTGDPDNGDFADGEVIAVYGAVDTGALQG